ncbi:MAG: sugar phosphate isomerase/epimerase family protein [Victivallaceae bacterium]
MTEVEAKTGISTWFLPAGNGEGLSQALDMVKEAGFKGIELYAGVGGTIGHPFTCDSVAVWPRDYGKEERKKLRRELAPFEFVSIHAGHLGVNIAGVNPGWREESVRQYVDCMKLARDINARVVTFHPGGQTPGVLIPESVVEEHDIGCGRILARLAEEYDLMAGYEIVKDFESQKRVIDAIGHPRFGLTLDIGHAVLGKTDPIVWIENFKGRINMTHLNSVTKMWHGYTEHEPWERNNVLDYPGIFAKLQEVGYEGPFVFELQGISLRQTIEVCRRAKDMFLNTWYKGHE